MAYVPTILLLLMIHELQVLPQVLAFAFLLVSASTVAMIPVLQYLFGLANMGWTWQHAALFAAMLGSTDCVAVSAVLKAGDAVAKVKTPSAKGCV